MAAKRSPEAIARQVFRVLARRELYRKACWMRLLIDQLDDLLNETKDVLQAGLARADWITVDDIGARRRGANAVCTEIGDDNFAWSGTTGSKSRLNFSGLLRAGHANCVINDAALYYTRKQTRSDTGRGCCDAFLGLAKTCLKLGVTLWDSVGTRIGTAGVQAIAPLADIIRWRGQLA